MKTAIAFAILVVMVAVVFQNKWPSCDAHSPHGPRIGDVIVIGGCP